ncbi:MAG: ribonuclease P protein component [Bacteroidia bacterium]|nr:ribonuclease P protein component [Bacteroidia bacterium]
MNNTLCKAERLNKKLIIGKMFEGGQSKSFSIFPLRIVYLPIESSETPASLLISVSKRHFKRAVKRNRVKRQIREAYRKNKHELHRVLSEKSNHLAIAVIYLSNEIIESAVLEEKMKIALARLTEKLQ